MAAAAALANPIAAAVYGVTGLGLMGLGTGIEFMSFYLANQLL